MEVLVTGFEPFKKEKVNPSWETCKTISKEDFADTRVVTKKLPVIFDETRKKVIELISDIKPDVIIHLGEAGGRTHISVERIAINCDHASLKDNAGQKREHQLIEPKGKDGYFATIPVVKIVRTQQKAGIPAVISNSAGTYLCNHVLYGTLHYIQEEGFLTKAGFIHLPYLPEQTVSKPGYASMSLDLMVKAVRIAIEECNK